ncbi:hypothetical protein [Acinetobacter baumannii]|uniref:hypothetical protein n=1 Tax=Acinetobacter baumannii TaxID=470 RepID=UPI00339A1802
MMACQARRRRNLFSIQWQRWHVTPKSSDCVCCPMRMMVCHARHLPTMCAQLREMLNGTG